ncbi:ATPase, AAA family protein [Tritrichomonas foetus]|uniref:ATPase, AAA family protein n=1 Tax=Tritrichomonas foetus TaxID=1144522 RepID=A0A1J4K237_9EUKA|nr:ATPase, AAA family protein [Tritrichomonas foetus]|eukprot:OHT05299.1 ATPase, AAA family protein [Tritrichomonas foetus]
MNNNPYAVNKAQSYFNAGAKLLQQGAQMEKMQKYGPARQYYLQARSQFQLAFKCPPDHVAMIQERLQEFTDKCNERIDAIEHIQIVPNSNRNTGGGSSPGGSSGGSGKGGSNNDGESGEFKNKMESSILIEKPNVRFTDVAGLHAAKEALEEAVILPLRLPQFFTGERSPWRGILLYGPPGTGKSFLAQATAAEADNSTFLTCSTADLVSKWVGESEKLIRGLFDAAREHKPSIIFIDEIDSLLSERSENDSESARRIKTEFLIQIDGVGKSMDGILLLAATNIPWGLDPAVRRRFEKKIYIPLPDYEARKYLIRSRIQKTPNSLTDQDFDLIARNTEGFSGADIKILTREASYLSLRNLQKAEFFCEYNGMMWPCNPDQPGAVKMTWKEIDPKKLQPPLVNVNDFMYSLQNVRPSVSQGDLKRYEDWTKEFGQEGC